MQLTYRRADGSFLSVLNGMPYHVTTDDPLYSVATAMAAAMGDALGDEPVLVPPSAAEVLSQRRSVAQIDRGPLCKALLAAGILSPASAILASQGRWPTEFDAFLKQMTEGQQAVAQIDWADAYVVRYQNQMLQDAALLWCQGDAEAATALLDQLFGLT